MITPQDKSAVRTDSSQAGKRYGMNSKAVYCKIVVAILNVAWLSLEHAATAGEVEYQLSDVMLTNPERGFYRQFTARPEGEPLTLRSLQLLREEGITLLLRLYYLHEFRTGDLSDVQLKLIESDFRTIRQGGCKCILRFAYSSNIGEPDAPLEIVLRHLEQLKPLLQENADVIAVMQAGFIGAWGEWHNSTNGLESNDAMRTIAQQLLKALPASRCVQVRTPRHKRAILGSDLVLDRAGAFADTPQARLGHHNDCFLADKIDRGTYQLNRLAWDKQYVAKETRYVPMGGETCSPSEFTKTQNARAELKRMHWSYLNREFHPDVMDAWEQAGLLSEAKRSLGYRLALLSSSCDSDVEVGATWNVNLSLRNLGWAAPFNPRVVNLVLKVKESPHAFQATLPVDPREWLPGGPISMRFAIGIPKDMPPGEYELFLRLSDPEPRLKHRAEYAIQLANTGLWNSQTAAHALKQTVIVSKEPSTKPHDGEVWFEKSSLLESNAN